MSGERPPIHIEAPIDSVLARAIEALSRFPTDQSWVLIGGVALFIVRGLYKVDSRMPTIWSLD